jgi:hypothetical protein
MLTYAGVSWRMLAYAVNPPQQLTKSKHAGFPTGFTTTHLTIDYNYISAAAAAAATGVSVTAGMRASA